MSTNKNFNTLSWCVLAFTLILTALLFVLSACLPQQESAEIGYENRIFDTSRVHSLDIVMEDWEGFLADCMSEEYTNCTVLIDGETYRNVGLRAKGNTSLSQVQTYGNDRYSFKIEFDHYDSSNTYHGLDKLCLNNLIQDNTYMKDYLTYRMMGEFGVAAPLCSYVNISVNGEAWGLYLAVESVEESFLTRNYGTDYGALYKPDSMSMGARPGNGKDFQFDPENMAPPDSPQNADFPADFSTKGAVSSMDKPTKGAFKPPKDASGFMGNQNSDVLLTYTDDDPDSYANIFDNAKTPVSDADKTRLIKALAALGDSETATSALDPDTVIRYFVAHNFVLNFDSYTGSMIHNYYLYEKDGKLSMIPWDYNLAFGGFQFSNGNAASLVNYPIDTPVSGQPVDARPMLAWIFNNPEYTEQYHELFSEFITKYFKNGEFAEIFESTIAMIDPYVQADPTKFCSYDEFLTGAETLRTFCNLRAESIEKQLDGTIGSTEEAQEQNQTDLVNAGDLQIADMGTMNMGHMGRRGSNFPAAAPSGENNTQDPVPSGENHDQTPATPDESGRQMPASFNTNTRQTPAPPGSETIPAPPGRQNNTAPGTDQTASLFRLALSGAILLLGLLFACCFRRRSKPRKH